MPIPRHDGYHNPYHFFGGLWLPSPQDHLSHDELARLIELEPLIRDLEDRDQVVRYDLPRAFSELTTQETELWREIGVERPANLLLHPSGDIGALVACHLHNPTFYVKDPYCQETYSISNPTMQQINQAGFSSENCFIFDHICRRERTEDVLLFYEEKIYGVHEDFTLSLRKNMGAKIEICWGRHVRERMKKLVNLVPLKLWGQFRDVELHLELEGQNLKRFVIFVAHPQFFFYHGSFTESGVRFRRTSGGKQDQLLAVAARMGRIDIVDNFYETIHRPALYGQFSKKHREVVNQLEAEATCQLKTAFPQKYHEFELVKNGPEKTAYDRTTSQLSPSQLIRGDTEKEKLRRAHLIRQMSVSLLEAAGPVFVGSTTIRNILQLQLLSELPSDWDDILEWHEIPHPLATWIQQQGGLQIYQKPISSKEELLTAFYLLSPTNYSPGKETLMNIVVKVAAWYISRVQKQRHESVRDLIIPGVRPYGVVRRRCSRCYERVLDDIFASYAKEDPKKYVIWYRLSGCGRPTCLNVNGTHFAYLIPLDPNQGYKIATRRSLQCTRSADWEDYLLRLTEEERRPTHKEVQSLCANCGAKGFLDKKPRWTAEVPPRYVISVRKCKACKKRYCSFVPADTMIGTISKSSLSKKWKDMKKGGLDPTVYPRRPSILWSHKSYLTKRKELERERDLVLVGEEDLEGLIQEPKKRNFNPKSRLKP